MAKTYYYVSNLKTVYNMQTGTKSSTITDKRLSGKGALFFKDIYKHNFWTEIRGGKRINTFEVFKSKYTYLDI